MHGAQRSHVGKPAFRVAVGIHDQTSAIRHVDGRARLRCAVVAYSRVEQASRRVGRRPGTTDHQTAAEIGGNVAEHDCGIFGIGAEQAQHGVAAGTGADEDAGSEIGLIGVNTAAGQADIRVCGTGKNKPPPSPEML